jgi:transposase-like protein
MSQDVEVSQAQKCKELFPNVWVEGQGFTNQRCSRDAVADGRCTQHQHRSKEEREARSRATKIRTGTRNIVELVTEGLEHGDWRVLGYDSPAAWYAELTDFMLAPPDVRKRLAAALHNEGYSLRRIATELDVSKDTVARDLDDAQVSHHETPETVTGSDGKVYPASKPQPSPDAEAVATVPGTVSPAPEPVAPSMMTAALTVPDGTIKAAPDVIALQKENTELRKDNAALEHELENIQQTAARMFTKPCGHTTPWHEEAEAIAAWLEAGGYRWDWDAKQIVKGQQQ